MADVYLNVVQVAAATGIPSGAITRMCVEGRIEAMSNPDSARKFWRIKLSTLDAVRAAYEEMKAQLESARNAKIASSGRTSGGRLATAEDKIARLERIVAQLCDELGSSACGDPEGVVIS